MREKKSRSLLSGVFCVGHSAASWSGFVLKHSRASQRLPLIVWWVFVTLTSPSSSCNFRLRCLGVCVLASMHACTQQNMRLVVSFHLFSILFWVLVFSRSLFFSASLWLISDADTVVMDNSTLHLNTHMHARTHTLNLTLLSMIQLNSSVSVCARVCLCVLYSPKTWCAFSGSCFLRQKAEQLWQTTEEGMGREGEEVGIKKTKQERVGLFSVCEVK